MAELGIRVSTSFRAHIYHAEDQLSDECCSEDYDNDPYYQEIHIPEQLIQPEAAQFEDGEAVAELVEEPEAHPPNN